MWSLSDSTPATPIALSVRPFRQALPIVSVMMTPTSAPSFSLIAVRSRDADASGSVGSRTTKPVSILLASIPAAAMTRPWGVSTIRVVFFSVTLVASVRSDSESMRSSREAAATTRPSDFDTILLVTTTTSPEARPELPSGQTRLAQRSMIIDERSSPGWMFGIPSTAIT